MSATSQTRGVLRHRGPTASRRAAGAAALALVATTLAVVPATPAAAASAYLTGNDFCLNQCNDILPPGENGNATLAGILLHQTIGTRPAHSADQLGNYANLLDAYTGLTDEQIGSFYNEAAFGVPA